MEATYTKEQLLSVGKDLVSALIENCNSTSNISGFLKEYIAQLTSDDGIYQKLQIAMNRFAESGSRTKKEADMMMNTSQANSMALQDISTEFKNLNETIKSAQQGRKEMDLRVQKLNSQINEISNSIKSIQEVSELTKLLSFNASIEAARAGAAGKGFRIIANEVKTLSGRTSSISSEIDAKMREIENEIKTLVNENRAHDMFMDSLQRTAVDSTERLTKIQNDNDENVSFMRGILDQMSKNQSDILNATKEAESQNVREVNRIAARAAQSTIQTGDQLSFLYELKQLFDWFESHKELFA
ncbi:MAG: methyl-accepting chemotaxis protein [Treponema sp.]|nr:methyl-accepting chemotaxis protein [Treponema sp.]